jgi:hypothetical protein
MTELIKEYLSLKNWDDKIVFIRRVRGKIGKNHRVYKIFKTEVCKFNARQKIGDPIRSLFSGKLLQPGSVYYKRTLRRCNIVRHHSSCKDVLGGEGESLIDPITGKIIKRSGRRASKIIRKCSTKKA